MKKIALKKDQAFTNEGGMLPDNFHFSVMPLEIKDEMEENIYSLMGYKVVEVDDETFDKLLTGFSKMINFQLHVNLLWDKKEITL